MSTYYPGKKEVGRNPTYEDGLRAELAAAARLALVAYLKELVRENQHKLVRGLSKDEVTRIAEITLAGYCLKKAELETRELACFVKIQDAAERELGLFA